MRAPSGCRLDLEKPATSNKNIMNDSLIIAPQPAPPPIQLAPELAAEKEQALQASALIGKVDGRDSKIIAVRAQQGLKAFLSKLEKSRVALKEPLLVAGRKLDSFCATEARAVDVELGRVSQLVGEFDEQERRRVVEEERLQRLELERIEREKQAEIDRLRREQEAKEAEALRIQEAAERKVREEREAADRLVREATNKKQREAAEKARKEAEAAQARADEEKRRQETILSEERAKLAAKVESVEEKAGDAAYAAAKPVEITKVAGQRQSSDWEIVIEQPFVLAKFHPDLVDIKPRLADIKAALNDGREIRGIKAQRVHKSGVRLPVERKAIDI